MEFTANDIATMLKGEIAGDAETKIRNLATLEGAKEGDISFLSNPKYEHFVYSTQASAVIVKKGFRPKTSIDATLIMVDDPYLSFTTLLEEYHRMLSFQKEGTEPNAFMAESSKMGNHGYRGAFSYIGENVTIGENVKLYPHVYIGDNCRIGDNTILHSGVKVYANCKIGSQCVIHSGTVIGSDGFGFAPINYFIINKKSQIIHR